MTQLLRTTLLVSTLIASSSCSFYEGFKARRADQKIRIVDSQGKSHNVAMHTPQLNVDALAQQGKLTEEQIKNAPKPQSPQETSGNVYAAQDGQKNASAAERELARTLEMQTAEAPLKQEPKKTEIDVAEENITSDAIEYDLGKEEAKAEQVVEVIKDEPKTLPPVAKGIFVQAGSFTQIDHAEARLKILKTKVGKSKHSIMQAEVAGKTYYRVLFGPFENRKKAGEMVKDLSKKGYESLIVKN